MRTVETIKRDLVNDHLAEGVEYLEVFPEGTMAELAVMRSIPVGLRTYSKKPFLRGQSPLLVCKAYWQAQCADRFPTPGTGGML